MIECEETVEVVKTTRKTLRLTETQVLNVLRRWAEREHNMHLATVEVDCGSGGYLVGATITTTRVEACDD